MTASPFVPLALAAMLALGASLATGPTPQHSTHHPAEMTGAARAFATVAAALAQRLDYPR